MTEKQLQSKNNILDNITTLDKQLQKSEWVEPKATPQETLHDVKVDNFKDRATIEIKDKQITEAQDFTFSSENLQEIHQPKRRDLLESDIPQQAQPKEQSFGDSFITAMNNTFLMENTISDFMNLDNSFDTQLDYINKQRELEGKYALSFSTGPRNILWMGDSIERQNHEKLWKRGKETQPQWKEYFDSVEKYGLLFESQLIEHTDTRVKEEYEKNTKQMEVNSWVPNLLGSITAGAADPVMVATLAVPGGATTRLGAMSMRGTGGVLHTATKAMGYEAAIGTAGEVIMQPVIGSYKNDVGVPWSTVDVLTSIATGVGGGVAIRSAGSFVIDSVKLAKFKWRDDGTATYALRDPKNLDLYADVIATKAGHKDLEDVTIYSDYYKENEKAVIQSFVDAHNKDLPEGVDAVTPEDVKATYAEEIAKEAHEITQIQVDETLAILNEVSNEGLRIGRIGDPLEAQAENTRAIETLKKLEEENPDIADMIHDMYVAGRLRGAGVLFRDAEDVYGFDFKGEQYLKEHFPGLYDEYKSLKKAGKGDMSKGADQKTKELLDEWEQPEDYVPPKEQKTFAEKQAEAEARKVAEVKFQKLANDKQAEIDAKSAADKNLLDEWETPEGYVPPKEPKTFAEKQAENIGEPTFTAKELKILEKRSKIDADEAELDFLIKEHDNIIDMYNNFMKKTAREKAQVLKEAGAADVNELLGEAKTAIDRYKKLSKEKKTRDTKNNKESQEQKDKNKSINTTIDKKIKQQAKADQAKINKKSPYDVLEKQKKVIEKSDMSPEEKHKAIEKAEEVANTRADEIVQDAYVDIVEAIDDDNLIKFIDSDIEIDPITGTAIAGDSRLTSSEIDDLFDQITQAEKSLKC